MALMERIIRSCRFHPFTFFQDVLDMKSRVFYTFPAKRIPDQKEIPIYTAGMSRTKSVLNSCIHNDAQ